MSPEITFMPDRKSIRIRPGTTLFDAGKKARVTIRSRCGGKAACLMCKVIVEDQSGLAPMNDLEKLKLGDLIHQSVRLSCQARAIKDVKVIIPEDPLKAAVRLQLAKQQEDDYF